MGFRFQFLKHCQERGHSKRTFARDSQVLHRVQPPPPFFQGEEEVEPPTKFSKGAGLTGSQLLEGIAGKEGGDLFQGGCNFHIKNKLKSQIINDKKSL